MTENRHRGAMPENAVMQDPEDGHRAAGPSDGGHVSSLPVPLSSGTDVESALDGCRAVLARARNDLERLTVRDQARAAAAAAAILKRSDIQVAASELVSDAERAIHRANPPSKRGPRDSNSFVPPGHEIPSELIRKIRQAHSKVSDDEFEALKSSHRQMQLPITRQSIREHARARDKASRQIAADRRWAAREARSGASEAPVGHVCDIAALAGLVGAETVDLVITDPPYEQKSLEVWKHLGAFAAHALKPGGMLIAMSGNRYLPQVMNLTIDGGGGAIQWWWQTAFFMRPGAGTAMFWDRGQFQSWKPLLMFSKGGRALLKDKGFWFKDSLIVEPEAGGSRDGHPCAQTLSGAGEIVSKFSAPGDHVCDPFCGGGSVPFAAAVKGCRVVFADIDAGCVADTRARLEQHLRPPADSEQPACSGISCC